MASNAAFILSIVPRPNNPRGRVSGPCSPVGTRIATISGRGCLAARRLFEAGVRRVEVTLTGWDTHAATHGGHREKPAILDPALAALMSDPHDRQLLDQRAVVCGG